MNVTLLTLSICLQWNLIKWPHNTYEFNTTQPGIEFNRKDATGGVWLGNRNATIKKLRVEFILRALNCDFSYTFLLLFALFLVSHSLTFVIKKKRIMLKHAISSL